MLTVFTTRAATRRERSRQWSALTRAPLVEFTDDREASMRGGTFGPAMLCLVSMGSHRVEQRHNAREHAPAALKFLFQEDGCTTVHQAGHTQTLQPGQWCAVRKDMDFVLDAPRHSRQLTLTLPCSVLSRPDHPVEWWRMSRPFTRGLAHVLHATSSAAIHAGGVLVEAERAQIGSHVVQQADMLIRAVLADDLRDQREERRAEVMAYIDRHLADFDLGVESIARAFGFSKRTIHKLFEGEAQTVARLIWDRRLEACRSDMTDPALAGRSLTEIAHMWAFADSQHFSRAFKARFGQTPREYRQHAHSPAAIARSVTNLR
ncbi:helix-turn-helix domain-containing protein [Novosphingobium sp. FSY-8]|uniref:Helix-turn-helix domain-containing protein n=1 Tax=Novosphingobium ovatum TaxID=1908523 RepID=A0ABW9XFW1_9SPHN|nr:helix-turn-helix domain-containing protein [Novosphingobium ovatum]NBC37432.1 helix-turn-helix domain-containing protein [Novosphingobium ovatum]